MRGKSSKVSAQLETSNRSVLARVGYLESIIQLPAEHQKNVVLLTALKSQGGLAKLSVSENFISPMSLNTLKNRAKWCVKGLTTGQVKNRSAENPTAERSGQPGYSTAGIGEPAPEQDDHSIILDRYLDCLDNLVVGGDSATGCRTRWPTP